MVRSAPMRDRILDAAEVLVLDRGFSATTVEAVLERAGTSKGAFFHHFPTKHALGEALVERYARTDADVLDAAVRSAEATAGDPAAQVVALVRYFEDAADDLALTQPGCLFVSFIYEHVPDTSRTRTLIEESIELWRRRILTMLERAGEAQAPALPVDLPSLADHVFTTFEGAFILARATGSGAHVRAQLRHLRHYLELLFPDTAR